MSTIVFRTERDKDRAKVTLAFRKLSPASRITLRALWGGKPVDISAAKAAAFDAMRCATTANGQSMGRRADADKVMRLWTSITDAEPATLAQIEDAELKAEVERLTAVIDERAREYLDTEANLYKAIHDAREDADRQSQRAEQAEYDADLLRRQRDDEAKTHRINRKVSEYARSLLDQIGRAKVEGFIEGLRDA